MPNCIPCRRKIINTDVRNAGVRIIVAALNYRNKGMDCIQEREWRLILEKDTGSIYIFDQLAEITDGRSR